MNYKLEFPVEIYFTFDLKKYHRRFYDEVKYYEENKEELYKTIESNFNWWCKLNNVLIPDPTMSESLWKIMCEKYEDARSFFYKNIKDKNFYPISYIETDESDYILFGIK